MPPCLSGAHDDVVKKFKSPSVATAVRLPNILREHNDWAWRDWPPRDLGQSMC
ncbi:hypothetical protein DAEQUDRAFT_727162 [Daedalea quercina L-15889]|uniref:Uncharacterized protein n=1 Tax=Daedalea quercina L-15889 TaxID=1314783 RepID=A0A165Q465_9APHY|nr:hypothetical protein DAEQUDRAFT_727162 [Daedalea quercina L-15889]